ncbi:MAG: hypothetical protein ACO37E_06760, partial [Lutimaribacter sp.]
MGKKPVIVWPRAMRACISVLLLMLWSMATPLFVSHIRRLQGQSGKNVAMRRFINFLLTKFRAHAPMPPFG